MHSKTFRSITALLGYGLIGTIMLCLVFFTRPKHQTEINHLNQENTQLAKQYHQLVDQHRQLNQAYIDKHGYQKTITTTDGTLFILPYHSQSTTKTEVHTPDMVEIEQQQHAIKKQYNQNNDKLTQYQAPIKTLSNNYQDTQITYWSNNTVAIESLTRILLYILPTIIILIGIIKSIQIANEKE